MDIINLKTIRNCFVLLVFLMLSYILKVILTTPSVDSLQSMVYLNLDSTSTYNKTPISIDDTRQSVSKHSLSLCEMYSSFKHFNDVREAAHANYSKVSVYRTGDDNFKIGDTIQVGIELYDGYGRPKTVGGDIIRIWMTEPALQSSISGYVIDHLNGSYTGHVLAAWQGAPTIHVSIAWTREHVSLLINHIEKKGILYDMFAIFKHGSKKDKTRCNIRPIITGFTDTCNYTEFNNGINWYCGAPSGELNCSHWSLVEGVVRFHNLSTKENNFVATHKHMQISMNPSVTIQGDEKMSFNNEKPCYNRPSEETWREYVPTGYYHKSRWRFTGCHSSLVPNYETYAKCLRNTHLAMLGDSNIRNWFYRIQEFIKLKITTTNYNGTRKWHSYLAAENKDLNISMEFSPHEYPFYVGGASDKHSVKSVAYRLDRISVSNRTSIIVVIHLYFHLAKIPPYEYRRHVRDARMGVARLLQRYPRAKIFMKGPHCFSYKDVREPIDFFGRVQAQIEFEEYYELLDKVYFLNQWDLTSAVANVNVHPDDKVNSDMVNNFLSYVCI